MNPRSSGISYKAVSWFVSDKLSTEIRLGMDQLQAVTLQIAVLLDKPSDFPWGLWR